MTRPLHVQWTLNLGVDLQVPVVRGVSSVVLLIYITALSIVTKTRIQVQAPIAIMFKTKCDRYGFVSESEKLKTPISSRTFQRVETAKQRKRRVALETLRSQKWLDMMKSSLLSHPKLTSRCWKGVRSVRIFDFQIIKHTNETNTLRSNTGTGRAEKLGLADSCGGTCCDARL